jgi:hypothetical protein
VFCSAWTRDSLDHVQWESLLHSAFGLPLELPPLHQGAGGQQQHERPLEPRSHPGFRDRHRRRLRVPRSDHGMIIVGSLGRHEGEEDVRGTTDSVRIPAARPTSRFRRLQPHHHRSHKPSGRSRARPRPRWQCTGVRLADIDLTKKIVKPIRTPCQIRGGVGWSSRWWW